MKQPMLFVIGTALTLGTAEAQQTDIDAGETIYSKVCVNCHGPAGQGLASFPALAGRDAEYIASRLTQYRAGEKVGANSALMMPNAVDLSDDDIASLAAYVSTTFQ